MCVACVSMYEDRTPSSSGSKPSICVVASYQTQWQKRAVLSYHLAAAGSNDGSKKKAWRRVTVPPSLLPEPHRRKTYLFFQALCDRQKAWLIATQAVASALWPLWCVCLGVTASRL